MRFHVIIPSVHDDAGLTGDYFNVPNINLLPIVEKNLIGYLLNDLCNSDIVKNRISAIHLIVDKKHIGFYHDHINPMPPNVELVPYSYNEKNGILYTVNKVAQGLTEPFMIIYGDTLLKNNVIDKLLETADTLACNNPNDEWLVIVLARDDINSQRRQLSEESAHLIQNRWGYIIADTLGCQSLDPDCLIITKDHIRDVIYKPSYVPFIDAQAGEDIFIETGAMVFSNQLWQQFIKRQEKDPLGKHSIINAARHTFIDQDFLVKGLVINRDHWLDINYPWEFLMANDYLLQCCIYDWLKDKGSSSILSDSFIIAKNIEDLRNSYFEEFTGSAPATQAHAIDPAFKFSFDNDDDIYGIEPGAQIAGYLIIPRPKQPAANIFIGNGCVFNGINVLKQGAKINNGALVTNSVICENVRIGSDSIIDHSIVMKNARISESSQISYSLIGKGAFIGPNVSIASKRADPYDPKPMRYYALSTTVKHHERFGAIIGDNAVIGRNSLIYPGRKVGKDSLIGIGSSIFHSCQAGSLINTESN